VSDSREYPSRPVVGVGAVVLISPADAARYGWSGETANPGVVLVKRKYEPLQGQWTLPGGGVEVGETLEAGIARELAEETGLIVDVGPIVEVFDRIVPDDEGRTRYHYVLIDYLCLPTGGRLRAGSDVAEVALADVNGLDRYGVNEKARSVIRKAMPYADTR
jgi:ADP-ribose pyrophosphatase YjhB (NUDIX family)